MRGNARVLQLVEGRGEQGAEVCIPGFQGSGQEPVEDRCEPRVPAQGAVAEFRQQGAIAADYSRRLAGERRIQRFPAGNGSDHPGRGSADLRSLSGQIVPRAQTDQRGY